MITRNKKATIQIQDAEAYTSSAIYMFGFIGAAVHCMLTATGFWMAVIGLLKALAWPAFLVYWAQVFGNFWECE